MKINLIRDKAMNSFEQISIRVRSVLLAFFLVSFFVTTGAAQSESERVFKAGAALSDVTPPLGALIVGGWQPIPATHIHDPLHARSLVLDDGQTRIAIVVIDNVGVPRPLLDEAKRLAEEETGIPAENILMSATHTHSAASARGENYLSLDTDLNDYQLFMARRIADGIRCAINNLEPARIGWGSGHSPEHVFNRRWFLKPGVKIPNPFGGYDQVRMNPGVGNPDLLKPAGPTDPEVAFLSVQSLDGRPIAVLANYSLHYVGGVRRGDISADYFAYFAQRLEELLKAEDNDPPFVGIMSNGTSGDINNIPWGSTEPRKRYEAYEKMKEVGYSVAAEVYKASLTVEHQDWVPLGMKQVEIEMGLRVPTDEQLTFARQILAKPESAEMHHHRERTYAERVLAMADYPDSIPYILQAVRIGDLGITAIPNEVFVEMGLELKERTPFEQTFTISLANGSYGYLPTVEHHKLGGYETWLGTSRLEIGAAPRIIDTLVSMLEELNGATRQSANR